VAGPEGTTRRPSRSKGASSPAAASSVQGEQVAVEAGGTFRAEVPLKKGKQKIAVVTVDALGRRKQIEAWCSATIRFRTSRSRKGSGMAA